MKYNRSSSHIARLIACVNDEAGLWVTDIPHDTMWQKSGVPRLLLSHDLRYSSVSQQDPMFTHREELEGERNFDMPSLAIQLQNECRSRERQPGKQPLSRLPFALYAEIHLIDRSNFQRNLLGCHAIQGPIWVAWLDLKVLLCSPPPPKTHQRSSCDANLIAMSDFQSVYATALSTSAYFELVPLLIQLPSSLHNSSRLRSLATPSAESCRYNRRGVRLQS